MGKTLTLDPYVCIDVAHGEKTAPLGFCESIFLIKDAISANLPVFSSCRSSSVV